MRNLGIYLQQEINHVGISTFVIQPTMFQLDSTALCSFSCTEKQVAQMWCEKKIFLAKQRPRRFEETKSILRP